VALPAIATTIVRSVIIASSIATAAASSIATATASSIVVVEAIVVVVVVSVVVEAIVVVVVSAVAASMPLIATTTTAAAATVTTTLASAQCISGTGLVGPLPQLTIVIPAILGVLDVIAGITLYIAPPTTSTVRTLAVTLNCSIGVRPFVVVTLTVAVFNGRRSFNSNILPLRSTQHTGGHCQ